MKGIAVPRSIMEARTIQYCRKACHPCVFSVCPQMFMFSDPYRGSWPPKHRSNVDPISTCCRLNFGVASTSLFDVDIASTQCRYCVDMASTLHRYQNLISIVVRPHSSACSFSATPIEDPGPPNIETMSVRYRHDVEIVSILPSISKSNFGSIST